ncbi:hypothetical protein [Longitalea arenae]|uniref:hypothetical protein n=1 Tax=Longitalea arenae TaxID=2812558 RepID=UPI0019689E63|nr:hypothetical protein [Longitalea arenae]
MQNKFRRSFIVTAFLLTGLVSKAQHADSSFSGIRTATQQKYGLNPSVSLSARVIATPKDVLAMFHEAGMAPTEHQLTAAEQQKVETAFAMLPPLHQRVLKDRLRSISFLDNMPNTALTSTLNYDERYNVFHITFRAAILHETVTHWLTEKERTCFDTAHSPARVNINGGQLDAFVYVLIHETTHVVDASLGITDKRPGKLSESNQVADFAAGIWEDRTTLTPTLRDSVLQGIAFRYGGKKVAVTQAPDLYKALQKTPFVSLYGSCARSEDLAEYVTVYHMTQHLKQPFRIEVSSKGKKLLAYEPMQSKLVRRRLGMMRWFYV